MEHYGIEVPLSTWWAIVLRHAEAIDGRPQAAAQIPERDGVAQLIGEIDGSMIPVVATAEPNDQSPPVDRRKTRQVGWKEARLSLVHEPGAVTPVFGATVGACEEAGEMLLRTAVQAGLVVVETAAEQMATVTQQMPLLVQPILAAVAVEVEQPQGLAGLEL